MPAALFKGLLVTLGAAIVAAARNRGADAFEIVTIATVAAGAVVYVVMQIRDYRPNKRLREDLSDARRELDRLQASFDSQKTRAAELERSRDFEGAFASLVDRIRDSRQANQKEHLELTAQIAALTNAVAAAAQAASIRQE